MTETLVRIEAPHFVAGLTAANGRVIRVAPILAYMIGWEGRQVAWYCSRKGWRWQALPHNDHDLPS